MNERDLGESGLGEAIDRLRERLLNPSAGDAILSLGDSLDWLYRLDQYHAGTIGWTAFNKLRTASVGGETEAALIYARGLFTHSLVPAAHLVVTRPGSYVVHRSGGRRGGAVGIGRGAASEVMWKDFGDLPAPGQPEKHGRDQMYQQHVQGKRVLPPVEAAAKFITGIPR